MKSFIEQFEAARRAAVPIIAVETFDQQSTVRIIAKAMNGRGPVLQWDCVRGLSALNDKAKAIVKQACQTPEGPMDPAMATSNPSEMLAKMGADAFQKESTMLFMMNAHRFLETDPVVAQGLCNLRDIYKSNESHVVLCGPSIPLPTELRQDVMILTEPLPPREQIDVIVKEICEAAGIAVPADAEKIADALIGLSEFSAEQTLATCTGPQADGNVDIDRKQLWERKCKAVEQTPGLSIWRGGDTFKDIYGCTNIKTFLSAVLKSKVPPLAIIFIDEIEKMMAGAQGDTSGVSQEQHGELLSFMQDNDVEGMIFVGPPGAAKSAVAKASGGEGNIPVVAFNLGGMKAALVGESGRRLREALRVAKAISQSRMLFIATSNNINTISPELKRRFTFGTFFFDLPTQEELVGIWTLYIKKYGITKAQVDAEKLEDKDWTGAEVRTCCKIAANLGIKLSEAAQYIVPVARAAADRIDQLRKEADGKYINAGASGVYQMNEVKTAPTPRRKFAD